jgi:DNA modification methylase
VSGVTDLRLGRWQVALRDVESCDSLITDPPYSQRTANGYRTTGIDERGIRYGHITEEDAEELAMLWAWRVQRWAVIFSDHIAWRWHETAWKRAGWYTFPPVGWVKRGAVPRLRGDGPASQMDHVMVARRVGIVDGHRPGWYLVDTPRAVPGPTGVTGNKDPNGMRALVRHYSRRGDLVIDPYAGSGTTALACALEGRRCITSEVDPATYEIARRRLSSYTPDLPLMEGQEA